MIFNFSDKNLIYTLSICFLGYFFIFSFSLFILSCSILIVFHIKDIRVFWSNFMVSILIAHFQRYCIFLSLHLIFSFLGSVVFLLFSLLNFSGVIQNWCLPRDLLLVCFGKFLFWKQGWGAGWYTEVPGCYPISRKYSA